MTQDTKISLKIFAIILAVIILVKGIISFHKFWLLIENDPMTFALRNESIRFEKQEIQKIVEKYDTPSVDTVDRLVLENGSYQSIASGTLQLASWYNYHCLNPNDCKTTYCTQEKWENNECYSQLNQTCASRNYQRGSLLKVTNIKNKKWILCRCNDYVENPDVDIDLSQKSFEWLADLSEGIIKVKIEEL